MTKCETRKQLSYSRLGTCISQEYGGSNLPLVWQSLIVPSYWQMGGGCMGNKHDKSGKSHLPTCYQNPPFSWENTCTKSGMCCFSVVPLIENSDGWASYRFCLFLWTFPFECALEYGTIDFNKTSRVSYV
jgi:hypothetical protein